MLTGSIYRDQSMLKESAFVVVVCLPSSQQQGHATYTHWANQAKFSDREHSISMQNMGKANYEARNSRK